MPKNFRLSKSRSMKDALTQFTNKVSASVAAAAVEAYAEAGLEAFISCLPAVTMKTRLNARMSLDGFPDALKFELVNHGKGGNEPIFEYDEQGAREHKATMATAWVFRDWKAKVGATEHVDVRAKVQGNFAKRLIQSAHPGSKSKIATQKMTSYRLRFYTNRMASEEPLLAYILNRDSLPDISLVGLHLARIKQLLDNSFVNQLQYYLAYDGKFQKALNANMAQNA